MISSITGRDFDMSEDSEFLFNEMFIREEKAFLNSLI
jgi:hypothetical protein